MATITDVRVALAAAVGVLGDIQASPFVLADPTPPYAHVYPGGEAGNIEYDQTMGRGLDLVPFCVEVFTASPFDIGAQTVLDEYLAPYGGRSIKAALEVDKTLGGIVDDLRVVACTGFTPVVLTRRGQTDPMLCATWHVEVFMRGV